VRANWTTRTFCAAVIAVTTIPLGRQLMRSDPVVAASLQPPACPTYVATQGNDTSMTAPTLTAAGCSITDGNYVRTDQTVLVHGRGQVSGHCRVQYLSGYPLACNPSSETDRTINNIHLRYIAPGMTSEFSMGNIWGKNPSTGTTPYYTQTLDSANTVSSTGPLSYSLGATRFGRNQISAEMWVNITNCNILPQTSPKQTVVFHAVKCLPTFNQDVNGKVLHLPESTAAHPIKVSVPEGHLADAVDAMLAQWVPNCRDTALTSI
jgi:hypothetical protein